MKCWVLMWSHTYRLYWMAQESKPQVIGGMLAWSEHKFDEKYKNCLRCGGRFE